MLVLRYNYSHDPADMVNASTFLAQSLDYYRTLAKLGGEHYEFANGMQTSQRQIPVKGGANGHPANYLWSQLVPTYENELAKFRRQVDAIQRGASVATDDSTIKPLPAAGFELPGDKSAEYTVKVGATVFTDGPNAIAKVAPELSGLPGIRIPDKDARAGNYQPIEFSTTGPVQVLIGYFNSTDKAFLQPPQLETDAQAADRGSVNRSSTTPSLSRVFRPSMSTPSISTPARTSSMCAAPAALSSSA